MDDRSEQLMVIVIITIVFLVGAVGFYVGNKNGYRNGQIDAINGEIHYRLERQADNSMDWVSCGGVCGGEGN